MSDAERIAIVEEQISQLCDQLYRLLEKQRKYLSNLPDPSYAEGVRDAEKLIFIHKAELFEKLETKNQEQPSVRDAKKAIMINNR